ncbi:MAG: DegT/DnrJ/EryC1/StrS family aminotransferase [Clostridium sp.]|jgi:dTDP-4-amino-4,6-dideoxygalactose transaminase|uniref:DegT/DnrJ/EryC1/StrS family aminotransferase n=1 Tax=Clostridium sp. TaxID=1506 RepID=UPI0025C1D81F|nr:DegT/DnrJ/EryC1/StrS family aminotransferase [Clostridium sp.]MCH3963148.1 DegT/DnrJ/EryC1/StrS family aminotransferase [Clostridium sp.]MCI1716389.1 DegT/DnrJ/EryC1/StrS family aminotransferase [Clostridium sp.]MCI1800729.1 DegT/DnrJ/EryC1/StrS family aminotransferase [Clostridium sp.]MCI1814616.1 DegT/DnrJ/EryC1/StrS family aminotransferase [Clostridium sp.]MCI1871526.1 DegT/DnrJ/EryC1/StrS family aminotransferase [Clostridium sp.]
MKVNFYSPQREYHEKKLEFDNAISKVLESGNFILGNEVSSLEDAVKKYTGAKYAVGVASGTDALVIASDILGFKDGKEVITSPFTFLASASCLAKHNAKPVFVDIDEDSFSMDPDRIEEKITDKTAGILPIHLFSQMCNMDKIMGIARSHNLKVLEDAAEAFGMRWKGNSTEFRHSGTIGDMGIFSFFPTKTLGSYGDAGMIVTNDDELGKHAKMFRVHGASKKYHYDYIGYNSRLDTIQAAILLVKLKYINNAIEKRAVAAKLYEERLSDCQHIKFPKIKGNQHGVYYVFNILAENRDELAAYLKENEIGNSIYYPIPLHLQKCFSYLGYKKGDFPVAEKLSKEVIALPIYPEITEKEIDFVCDTIKKFYKK